MCQDGMSDALKTTKKKSAESIYRTSWEIIIVLNDA